MKLKNNCIIREISGEKVIIIQGDTGVNLTRVVSLNRTAELLWNRFSEIEFNSSDLAEYLTENFGIEYETAHRDSIKWITKMRDAGLILTE